VDESREVVLSERLADARGKQVAFVSHCLLNENVRYLAALSDPAGSQRWWRSSSTEESASARCPAPSNTLGAAS
jgi:hypothetical protein